MTEIEQFMEITSGRTFLRIEDLVGQLDAAGFWASDWLATATASAKKAKARQMIRQAKDADGWPLYASLLLTPAQGKPYRAYQLELFMNGDNYRQVIHSWVARADHARRMAEFYCSRLQ